MFLILQEFLQRISFFKRLQQPHPNNSLFFQRFIEARNSLRKTSMKISVLLYGSLDLAIFTRNARKRHLGSMRVQMMIFFNFLISMYAMLMKLLIIYFHTHARMSRNKSLLKARKNIGCILGRSPGRI